MTFVPLAGDVSFGGCILAMRNNRVLSENM